LGTIVAIVAVLSLTRFIVGTHIKSLTQDIPPTPCCPLSNRATARATLCMVEKNYNETFYASLKVDEQKIKNPLLF
jgi:hypothetical protein